MSKRIISLMERLNPFWQRRRYTTAGSVEGRDIPDLSKRPMMRKMYKNFLIKGGSINRLDREAPSRLNPLNIFNRLYVKKKDVLLDME